MSDTHCAVVQKASEKLQQFLDRSKAERIVVAYSGGVDSTVLLHLVKGLSEELHFKLLAVHINHRLDPKADDWVAHCRNQAKCLGVAYQALEIQVPHKHRQGIEAAAREMRYQALQSIMGAHDLLLTAHHCNDQSETVLLRLLRGSGPTGLKAIQEYRSLSEGALGRPLLSIPRSDILRYAQDKRLDWLEDPSNEDLKYARNYLRHRVIPRLEKHWPMWHETVARASVHQATADAIIGSEAQRYLHRCLLPNSSNLLLRVFVTLSSAHQHLVLRAWCKLNHIPTLDMQQLARLCDAISAHIYKRNASGSGIIYARSDIGIGVYHGTLCAIKPLRSISISPLEWHRGKDCEIPQLNLKLRRTELMRQAPALFNQALIVDFRRGGERCACRDSSKQTFHKSLKKIFQEHRIPAWQRDRTPLIYDQGRLRLIWGITECA